MVLGLVAALSGHGVMDEVIRAGPAIHPAIAETLDQRIIARAPDQNFIAVSAAHSCIRPNCRDTTRSARDFHSITG